MSNPALDALRRNVSGKVATGEAEAIAGIPVGAHPLQFACPSCGADVFDPCRVSISDAYHETRHREADAADWRALRAEMPIYGPVPLFTPVDVMRGQTGLDI